VFVTADHHLNQVSNMLRQTFAAKREKDQPSLFTIGFGKVGLDGRIPILDSASEEPQEPAVEKPKKPKEAGPGRPRKQGTTSEATAKLQPKDKR
jgi:hypothetical protein